MVGYEYLIRTLKCQIADLHQMYQQRQECDTRWGPVESPSGHRWYNLDLVGYLECGARGFADHSRADISVSFDDEAAGWWELEIPLIEYEIGRPLDSEVCYWEDVAEILRLGQVYE